MRNALIIISALALIALYNYHLACHLAVGVSTMLFLYKVTYHEQKKH